MGSFDSFKVTRVTSLAQSIDAAGIYDLRTILPDHSLLTWKIEVIKIRILKNRQFNGQKKKYICIDIATFR
jgi:putative NIF3 family GTP cyclohydrolase 1 type 2